MSLRFSPRIEAREVYAQDIGRLADKSSDRVCGDTMASNKAKGSGLEWFVRRGNAVRGPYSSMRVRHFVLEEKLGLDDEVSADRKTWKRLGSVAEVVPLQMRDDGDSIDAPEGETKEGRRAWPAMLIALLIIAALISGVYFAGDQTESRPIDCAAAPEPAAAFDGCRLTGVDWRSSALAGATFANAALADAILVEADLYRADLRYVDLSGADLSYARLEQAVLKGANLRHVDLTNADLRNADLSFADLSRARIGGARFESARLEGAIWVDGKRCEVGSCPR